MSIFSKFFTSSKLEQPEKRIEQEPDISEQLFVTEYIEEQEANQQVVHDSLLDQLLARNYEELGFQEGYDLHSMDHMRNRQDSIVASFREVIRKELERLRAEETNISHYANETVKEFMPEQYRKVQNQIDGIQLMRSKLEAELELMLDRQGYCERAICDYKTGFQKGFSLFLDEHHFSDRYQA